MAASTRLVPASTSTVRPLIVTLGTSYAPFSNQFSRSILEIPPVGEGAGLLLDVAVDLVLGSLVERLHPTDRRGPPGAERVAAGVGGDREGDLAVPPRSPARLEPLGHQAHPV